MHEDFPSCHQQHQAGSGKGAAKAAHRRLALAAVVVIRWSKNIDVIFIMLECFVLLVNFYNRSGLFSQKEKNMYLQKEDLAS